MRPPGILHLFLDALFKTDAGKWRKVQQSAARMDRVLEHTDLWLEMEGLGLFSLIKNLRGCFQPHAGEFER